MVEAQQTLLKFLRIPPVGKNLVFERFSAIWSWEAKMFAMAAYLVENQNKNIRNLTLKGILLSLRNADYIPEKEVLKFLLNASCFCLENQ